MNIGIRINLMLRMLMSETKSEWRFFFRHCGRPNVYVAIVDNVRRVILSASLLAALSMTAKPPFVSPYYYGPNAFPIPDVLQNTADELTVSLCADYFSDKDGNTEDILLKTRIPLWTKRANLSLWWQVYEWYATPQAKGSLSGDVYVSVDLQLMVESRRRPSWTLRAALKTASGGGYDIGRYYDCPGYFFDTYFGKVFRFSQIGVHVCGGGGFLCWQTDNGRQNDAVQYAALFGISWKGFSVSETFSGYAGWQSNSKQYGSLVHDRPMSLKTNLSYLWNKWEINVMVQHGLIDYPYTQFQLGLTYSFDILSRLCRPAN